MRSILVLDFDGTITEHDIGDALCARFADPAWRDIDAAWERNEISLPEAQRRMWALLRAAPDELVQHLHAVGRLRPGLDALLDAAAARGAELWLASGGFDFYIEALLGARLGRFARAYFNRGELVDGGVRVAFPHDRLACGRCAVCKGLVCDQARAGGAEVVFVGDGASDRCAVGRADRLFAVRDSRLARACAERGAAYTPFSDLNEVAAALGAVSAPGR